VTAEDDRRHMRHALTLGMRGLGSVWPNPSVGCVIVQGDRIAGRGWTQPGGRPHAEVVALRQAGPLARGATAYVTLEPCSHHGQTPPCADALIAAGVARVAVALVDPDPRVSGRGLAALRNAGIAVTEGVDAAAAQRAHRGFLRRVTEGLPLVTLKLAASIDGRIATASGESRWITGPEARRAVHALRLCHDAVMVGGGTARADDPDLTVREMGRVRQPVRIVVDTGLRLDPACRLGRTARKVPLWICHGQGAPAARREAWESTGARLIACATEGGRVSLPDALRRLAGEGLTRVLGEGGGQFAASLLRADLVGDLVTFTAGKVIGAEGLPGLGAMELGRLADARAFRLDEVLAIGGDVMCRWSRAV
jgi:diaminohydroxyphosphoribosylaminopyrimidine deaminase/5-amino-6-(5-phosphoribosylamino)uracil reductase